VTVAWAEPAVRVVSAQYFRQPAGGARETSVRQMIRRVAGTIAAWGGSGGYFASEADAVAIEAELTWLLVHRRAAFNSPVWYNLGIEREPQCAGSFILSVADTLPSILELARTEGLLFKYGSGTGTNLSSPRSSRERLDGGGRAAVPVAFLRGLDAFAGATRWTPLYGTLAHAMHIQCGSNGTSTRPPPTRASTG
jgi:ribonucleoside-diphosphate reductase alpha chain